MQTQNVVQDVVRAGAGFVKTPFGTVRATGKEVGIDANRHQLLDWAAESGVTTLNGTRKLSVKLSPEDGSIVSMIPEIKLPAKALRAWTKDVLTESLNLIKAGRVKRHWASVPRKKRTRLETLMLTAERNQLAVDSYVPEDDQIRRIRFGRPTDVGADYDTMEPLFTAMGIKEAEAWLSGYITLHEPRSE